MEGKSPGIGQPNPISSTDSRGKKSLAVHFCFLPFLVYKAS